MVWWHIWRRVTGRWVTVTGKRREPVLLSTFYSASPAAVAAPVPCAGRPVHRETVPPVSGRGISLGERSERLKAAPGTFHHAPVKARPHGVADCPAAGDQQGPGRQVNPAPGGSAGTQGRRTCPVGECPPAPLTRGQDFLARPRAKPRDTDTAPRGPLMDLSWACRRPAVDLTPRRRAGCAGQISLSPAHPRGARVTRRWRGTRS